MPFQPINFANIKPQGNELLRNLVENLATGYTAGQIPYELQRQATKQNLLNAFQNLQNKQEPERFNSQMLNEQFIRALNSANTNKINTMLPLEQQELRLKNEYYPQDILSQIEARKILNDIKYQKLLSKNNGSNLTPAVKTANQSIIQSINNTIPLINDLIKFDSPGQLIGKYFSPNKQADYDARVSTITDSLISSLKLPKTNESIQMVDKIVRKRPREYDDKYQKRLSNLINDLYSRRERANSALQGNDIYEEGKKLYNKPENRVFNIETMEFE